MRLLFLIPFLFFSCTQEQDTHAETAFAIPQKLKSAEYDVCGKKLILEEASGELETSIGLMGRKGISMPNGMIFSFPYESPRSFWMKNVPFDIEIGYFNANKELVSWTKMKGTSPIQKESTLPSYPSKKPAKYAIETPVGFYSSLSPDQIKSCTFKLKK